jgi:hypothetical protein
MHSARTGNIYSVVSEKAEKFGQLGIDPRGEELGYHRFRRIAHGEPLLSRKKLLIHG